MAQTTLPTDWVLHNVPLDIWSLIFRIFHHESSIRAAAPEMIRLSHVCSSWRATIKDTPELWTKVSLVTRTNLFLHQPSTKAKLLSLVLKRSKNMPLTTMNEHVHGMSYRGGPVGLGFDLAPVKHFLDAVARSKTANLNLTALGAVLLGFQQNMSGMEGLPPARLLEELTLFSVYSREQPHCTELASRIWKDSSLLRTVSFHGDYITPDAVRWLQSAQFPLSQLTTLTMMADTIEAFFELLSLTPLLVTATIHIPENDEFSFEDTKMVRLESLQTLTLRTYFNKYLRQSDSDSDDEDLYGSYEAEEAEVEAVEEAEEAEEADAAEEVHGNVMRALEFIVAPSLKVLSLHLGNRNWSLKAFEKFMDGSSRPTIERLSLDALGVSHKDKLECLRMLPFLRELELTTRQEVGKPKRIRGGFWGALKEWDSGSGRFVLCPRFEKLTLGYDALSKTSIAVFADFVGERWKQSSGGNNFVLLLKEADSDKLAEREILIESIAEIDPLLKLTQESGLKLRIKPEFSIR
ncbi:hypothetical protein CVT26_010590 [Gymnopilus dilepis]|uniref:Uncharacterized protein n=1 Tax=Gymnopilus dilepis TaxID=231916 RepID=A0A409VZE4_9AGAR|nr:hypothetical protein CVT26_010590 [Gymnopilus dilepis]